MLVSRFVTIFLIPVPFILIWFNLLPITFFESLLGITIGYGFLFITSKVFYLLTGKIGIGQGDLDLLAFIGAFLGLTGCWISLLLGSIFGSIIGLIYIKVTKSDKSMKLPFGQFLAIGAMIFVLFSSYLESLIFRF